MTILETLHEFLQFFILEVSKDPYYGAMLLYDLFINELVLRVSIEVRKFARGIQFLRTMKTRSRLENHPQIITSLSKWATN